MSFIVQTRPSGSPLVEAVMHGYTEGSVTTIRPAECNWHRVLVRNHGDTHVRVSGPWTSAGELPYIEGVELMWIKFKLGAFMPHLPFGSCLDMEPILPGAASQSFWLKGSAWQFPTFENADTFIDKLLREDVLIVDPVVDARTLRHRFAHATGLSAKHIEQVHRAQRAAALLRHGVPILDATHDLGYYDRPHLTRSLKRWIVHTPAQLLGTVSD